MEDSFYQLRQTARIFFIKQIVSRYQWCRLQDLNPPPDDYKSSALPDELSRQALNYKGLKAIGRFYLFRNSAYLEHSSLFLKTEQIIPRTYSVDLRECSVQMVGASLIEGQAVFPNCSCRGD